MTTRADVLARVRLRLEDTGVTPLWSDAEIEEGMRWMLDEYSAWWPEQDRVTVAVLADAREVTIPAGITRVLRVVDPNERVLPQRAGIPLGYDRDELASWEQWAGELVLTQAAEAGDYVLWVEQAYGWPALTTDVWPTPERDISLIVAGAAQWCMEFRATEEWKRGSMPSGYEHRMRAVRAEYRRQLDVRRRRVGGGRVAAGG